MPVCQDCGSEKERLGQHLAMSNCQYPIFNVEIIDGLLLGDGDLHQNSKNASLRVRNTNKRWLEELSEIIPQSYGPRYVKSAEELAQRDNESGFNEGADASNYKDVWSWQTVKTEQLSKQRERWYDGSDKRVPKDLELTPSVVRHWIAGDGNANWTNSNFACVRFGRVDERDDELLVSKFQRLGFESAHRVGNSIRFSVEESRMLLKWSAPAPRGMDYKWESHSREDYDRLKP